MWARVDRTATAHRLKVSRTTRGGLCRPAGHDGGKPRPLPFHPSPALSISETVHDVPSQGVGGGVGRGVGRGVGLGVGDCV